ncbi:MAG TPA: 2-oxoacid:acceptor oxidoreductase family protein [Candidatus Wujingus californicus]|uniref:2-oxoacid:acceptor oxidoreductase family protein n=1 Tax=Candidatus Wujingus californicus TaxID=3367618 RepID=UPI001E15CDFE|nr:2-oxoacid:acceptor oxidoreductase family protein [Planctomycetota bacterium]
MLRIRFHGRGGLGAKVASRVLGTAAFLEGYYAQDFPLYGAERRGAPIASFTRISKEPILERGVITEPDVIIIMDETLLDDYMAHPLSGLKGGGVVFVNTTHTSTETKNKYKITEHVITFDITKVSLEMFGKPILSTLSGGVAAKITGINGEFLKKAVAKETSEITVDEELILKNVKAALYCFNAIQSVGIKTTYIVHKRTEVITIPYEPAVISSPAINSSANTPLRKTGNWRVFKPVWDYDICTQCMTCVVRCPDGCIKVNESGFPYTDYDNCKGCTICAEECPVKAIEKVREVHAW